MLMIRQWRHLKMLKRAGRGHDPTGRSGTWQGSCAVLCPACPHPGKNVPAETRAVSEATGYERMLSSWRSRTNHIRPAGSIACISPWPSNSARRSVYSQRPFNSAHTLLQLTEQYQPPSRSMSQLKAPIRRGSSQAQPMLVLNQATRNTTISLW